MSIQAKIPADTAHTLMQRNYAASSILFIKDLFPHAEQNVIFPLDLVWNILKRFEQFDLSVLSLVCRKWCDLTVQFRKIQIIEIYNQLPIKNRLEDLNPSNFLNISTLILHLSSDIENKHCDQLTQFRIELRIKYFKPGCTQAEIEYIYAINQFLKQSKKEIDQYDPIIYQCKKIEIRSIKDSLFREIAQDLIKNGHVKKAIEVIEEIREIDLSNECYSEIVMHYIEKGDFSSAKTIAYQMRGEGKTDSLIKVFQCYLKENDFENAYAVAKRIENRVKKDFCLFKLFNIHFKEEDYLSAEDVAERIQDSDECYTRLFEVFFNNKDFDRAENCAMKILNIQLRSDCFIKLFDSCIENHLLHNAKNALNQIVNEKIKEKKNIEILESFLKEGDLYYGRKIAENISHFVDRDDYLVKILEGFLSKQDLSSACETAQAIFQPIIRDSYLAKIFNMYMKKNDKYRSRLVAEKITDSKLKNECLIQCIKK